MNNKQKYRLQLDSGRIIGPFGLSELGQLNKNGHLTAKVKVSSFPLGEWKLLIEEKELHEAILKVPAQLARTEDDKMKTRFINLGSVDDADNCSTDDLTELVSEDIEQKDNSEVLTSAPSVGPIERDENKIEEGLSLDANLPVNESDDSTRAIDISKLALETYKTPSIESSNLDSAAVLDTEENKKGKRKVSKSFTLLLAAFLAIAFLWDSEEEGEGVKLAENELFTLPQTLDFSNEEKAKEFRLKGLELIRKNNFASLIQSCRFFKLSVENSFSGNPALGHLLGCYAQALDKVRTTENDINNVYQIFQYNRPYLNSSLHSALGASLFFYKVKKYQTAKRLAENFIRVKGQSISLLGVYGLSLLKAGDIIEGKRVIDELNRIKGQGKKLTSFAHEAMLEFYSLDENSVKYREVLKSALQKFNDEVFKEKVLQLYFRSKDLLGVSKLIKNYKGDLLQSSPRFKSILFMYLGIIQAGNGKTKEAAKTFSSGLSLYNLDELRELLSGLDQGGDELTSKLIEESKALEIIGKSQQLFMAGDTRGALLKALKATEIAPWHIPTALWLSKVQIFKGLFSDALENLEKIRKISPENRRMLQLLLELHSITRNEALFRRELDYARSTSFADTAEYFTSLGRYYYLRNEYKLAVKWYGKANSMSALDIGPYLKLIEILLKFKDFRGAKTLTVKALQIDPLNDKFHSYYAEILYEMDGVDTAIGYLRDTEKRIQGSKRLMADKAKYYYRSGKIKDFEKLKTKLLKLPSSQVDISFFRFLYSTSLKDGLYKDAMEYANIIMNKDPGDLKTKIETVKSLLEIGEVETAKRLALVARKQLPSYPMVNFYLAESLLQKNDSSLFDQALDYAKMEIKNNPQNSDSHYILGRVLLKKGIHLFKLGKKKEAGNAMKNATLNLEKAISRDSQSVRALLALGDIKFTLQYYNSALELYQRALSLNPSESEVHKKLGASYRAVGQGQLAKEAYQKYVELNPDADDVRRIRGIIKKLSY